MDRNEMATTQSVKKEMICENVNQSIEKLYEKLCIDLNLDIETKDDSWRCYEDIKKHYVLEGDQIHWLAVSIYVSCKKGNYLSKSSNNPISISRLLKSGNDLKLIEFFDKLHKWEDMQNLPIQIRNSIDQIEHSFNISSIIFQKYLFIFIQIFGGNEQKLISYDYYFQRTSIQINPKLNIKSKLKKCSIYHLYQFVWTIYALAKTIYPPTNNDLIASFHLLLASFIYVYQLTNHFHLHHLLKGPLINELCGDNELLIDKLCLMYSCSSEVTRVIYEEHLKKRLFQMTKNFNDIFEENKYIEIINDINNQYDEIVLRNCIIDERIFIENGNQLNDLLNSLNENRNSKSLENRTPLTANQHLTYITNQSNLHLTPISQANQLIHLLLTFIHEQQSKPSNHLIQLIGQRTFLDDLNQRIQQWENIFIRQYNSNGKISLTNDEEEEEVQFGSCKSRFDLSLKLFYLTLENILKIEKSRLLTNNSNDHQIKEIFHKLILNNEFVKSLLGLCLLLVLYSHSDQIHDLNWILNIYSLHGYSFLKMIEIFLKSSKELNQSRSFIKYLSSCEETILSSMVFETNSPLWNDIQLKGILSYQQISSMKSKQSNQFGTSPSNTNQYNLTLFSNQSPNSNNVCRKLFQTSNSNHSSNDLSISRSRSDPVVENSSINIRKTSPYTMFYRKLYDLVISRLNSVIVRLYGSYSSKCEEIVWNIFLYLFENHLEYLFRSRDLDQILLSTIYYSSKHYLFSKDEKDQLTWFRLIQSYKSMPNSKLKTLRSVFIRSINNNDQTLANEEHIVKDPCLTPSKPAGTIHIIDGNVFGDIASFYLEIYLKIPNLENDISKILKKDKLISFPKRYKRFVNSNEHIQINLGENVFVDYSSNKIQSNLFCSTNEEMKSSSSFDIKTNSSTNILSSSIQAGLNNRVETTRTRTEDGKFLTTISTISKINNSNSINQHLNNNNNNQKQILFGQSTNNSFKRKISEDFNSNSNSNCLTSLTKKVLQIENDRQTLQE